VIMPIDYSRYPDNWKTEIRPHDADIPRPPAEIVGVPEQEAEVQDG